MATKQWTPKTRDELKKLVDGGMSLADIEVVFVDDMSGLFEDSTRTDFSGIEEWNVSNVKNMYAMFRNAKHFNANINSWNVSKVTRMDSMFEGAESFNSNIDDWDIAKLLEGYFVIPDKRSLSSFSATPIDNDYIKREKGDWERKLQEGSKINFFANSPLASNPPKWFKEFENKKKEFIRKYEEREKEVADFFQQKEKKEEQKRKEDEAWQAKWQAEEAKEKVKKLIWIGLGVAALLYFFIK